MSTTPIHRLRKARHSVAICVAFTLAAGTVALSPVPAQASDTTAISDGTITWGLKRAFRSYLVGPIANGKVTISDPATDDGTQTTFTQASGTWSTQTATVATKGSVNYYGHHGALDFTISEPRITITDGTAQLVVDAVGSDKVSYHDLALANIDLSGAVSVNDGRVTITDAPTTITSAGVPLLSNFYSAGTSLDPINATFDARAASASSLSDVSVTRGTPGTVTVKVTPLTATGTVTLTGVGEDRTANVVEGAANFTFPDTTKPSSYPLTATYSGDSQLRSSTTKGTFTVTKTPTTSTITASTVDHGTTATVAVDVGPSTATGNVTLTGLGSPRVAPIEAGKANFTIPASTPAGSYPLQATYSGDSDHAASTGSGSLTISGPATLVVSHTRVSESASTTVTVTGTGFEPGQTTATRPPLAGKSGGLYIVIGKFASEWRPSHGAASSTRKVLASQTKWAVRAADMDTIGGTAAGAIELTDAGTFRTSMTFSKSELDAISGLTNDHTAYGVYTYPAGGATLAEWELAQPLTFTADTTLQVTPIAARYGRSSQVRVSTSPSTATGTVSLQGFGSAYTKNLVGGTAVFTLPATLRPATYSITARYSGSSAHTASVATGKLSIARAVAGVGVKVVTKPTSRKKGAIRVTLSGPKGVLAPSGKVTVRLTKGRKTYAFTTSVNRLRKITIPSRAKGTWKVSVMFGGSAYYAATGYSKAASFTVKK